MLLPCSAKHSYSNMVIVFIQIGWEIFYHLIPSIHYMILAKRLRKVSLIHYMMV